jgi:bacillithiol biosynthesis cysteine-adding enzyme BshC
MNISALPFFSDLAKDYLTKFSASPLKQFFPLPPSTDGLQGFLSKRSFDDEKRSGIAQLISEQAAALGVTSGAVEANIARLRSPKTFAVVTGQQVTLFGGPLYTIYKTATAIALAEQLRKQYPEYDFVPVFWLETEDHDLKEATSAAVLNKTFDLTHISYVPDGFDIVTIDQTWKKQVGPYPLDAAPLEAAIAQLTEALQPTEFTEKLIADLRNAYKIGRTIAEAFSCWLYHMFADQGLLVLDANNTQAKSLGREIFLKELESSPKLSEKVVLQTVHLEEHYHVQVKPRAINMFYLEDGERFAINEKERKTSEPRSYFLKGSKRTFTHEELVSMLVEHPERFSPNVLLRPLYQDTILPTAAYIGGPGEIAYFAQFKSAYDWADLPMPLIFPRVTATVVEDKFQKSLDKNAVTVSELLAGGSLVVEQLLNNLADEKLARLFEELDKALDEKLEELRHTIEAVDKSLDQSLNTLKGKVLTPVRDFGAKVQSADKRRHQTVRDQLGKALTALLPDAELQERTLSPIYFLNKYGPHFLIGLMAKIREDLRKISEHQIYQTSELLPSVGEKSTPESEEVRTSEAQVPFIPATAMES